MVLLDSQHATYPVRGAPKGGVLMMSMGELEPTLFASRASANRAIERTKTFLRAKGYGPSDSEHVPYRVLTMAEYDASRKKKRPRTTAV
jgi:hypothetical protein